MSPSADDEPVGLGNLGLRGEDAWIGGVGVVPSARRQGVGGELMRALHDEARERGVRNVWLEVIDRNESAFDLYVKLGYRRRTRARGVVAHRRAGRRVRERGSGGARHTQRLRELRTDGEPWQRADGTLEHLDDLRGLVTDDGAAVFRATGVVQLLQIAGGGAEELLRALRGFGAVSVLNLPADDPAAEALRALGATPAVRQREMVLEL